MARGWESKDIESQIEEALSAQRSRAPVQSEEQIALQRKREGLELSRTRVLHDLENARNPGYQAVLKDALAHLDKQLAELLRDL
jgi:molecular chaperone GrpE (heat shock protein)